MIAFLFWLLDKRLSGASRKGDLSTLYNIRKKAHRLDSLADVGITGAFLKRRSKRAT